MDYSRIYIELIERAKNRNLEGYKERHHVVPRCMGGDNNLRNIVELTAEEHYLAHLLLVKIYPTDEKLAFAAQLMTTDKHGNRSNNKLYGWLRKRHSDSQRGKPRSEETKRRMSEANKGKTLSEKTKKKISKSLLGNTYSLGFRHSAESKRKKIGNKYHLGHKHSEEARAKMSKAAKARRLKQSSNF